MSLKKLKHLLKFSSIQSIVVLVIMTIPHLLTASAQANPKGEIDWILVVDTSASMRGVGGTKNIFPSVKNSLNEFVNTARLGDTVTIYSFDTDVTLNANDIQITSNPDRGKLKQIITSLQAQGVRTHTGKAVQKALEHSSLLNQRADSLGRTVSIVFMTDGLEDVQGIPNPVSIPSNTQFLRQQECKPYIFFVSLGLEEHEKQLNDFATNPAICGKGQVLRDPGGVRLNQLAQNIRPVLTKPKPDVNLPTANLPPPLPIETTKPPNIIVIATILVLLVFLIVLTVICLIQSKTPWELVEDFRTRNRLEGALVMLEPSPKLLEEEISLSQQQKSRVYLSNLIPEIAATNSDGELVTVWRAGRKNIDLHCLKGVIIVNNKKINQDELYDEDIIEIGNIKLQFSWIKRQRPSEIGSGETNFYS